MPWRYLMHSTEGNNNKKSLSTKCCKSVCKTDIMEKQQKNAHTHTDTPTKKQLRNFTTHSYLIEYSAGAKERQALLEKYSTHAVPTRPKLLCWRNSCHIHIYSHNLMVNMVWWAPQKWGKRAADVEKRNFQSVHWRSALPYNRNIFRVCGLPAC